MGMIKTILLIILAIIAISHFFPNTYENGREWVVDKIGLPDDFLSGTNNETTNETEEIINNLNENESVSFNLSDLQCTTEGICHIGGSENGGE